MIREVKREEIPECVSLIKKAFLTVADEFGFTEENAPRFTAFSTTEERLMWHMDGEHRPMYVFEDDGVLCGYYSLLIQENNECELNNVAVLPDYRHKGIGKKLIDHAFPFHNFFCDYHSTFLPFTLKNLSLFVPAESGRGGRDAAYAAPLYQHL